MESDDKSIKYNEIEIDPMDSLFEKIHDARGGEMVLVHVSDYGKNGPSVRVCSIMKKKESILEQLLPSLVKNLLDE